MTYIGALASDDLIEIDQMLNTLCIEYGDHFSMVESPGLMDLVSVDHEYVEKFQAFVIGWHACSDWKDKC